MPSFPNSDADLDMRRRRALYRAWHRGMREMDLVLGSFCDAHIHELSEAELDELERLIEVPDQSLYLWVTDPAQTPQDYQSGLLDAICRSSAHRMPQRP